MSNYMHRTQPLYPGMAPCRLCQNEGKGAFTDIREIVDQSAAKEKLPFETPFYEINHWHDPGHELRDWERYCHGHGGLNGDLLIYGQTRDDAIANWNREMTPARGLVQRIRADVGL